MKQQETTTEYSLRFLVLRALVVIVLVVGVLVALRCLRVTVAERDVPAPIVEELTRDDAEPLPSSTEQP